VDGNTVVTCIISFERKKDGNLYGTFYWPCQLTNSESFGSSNLLSCIEDKKKCESMTAYDESYGSCFICKKSADNRFFSSLNHLACVKEEDCDFGTQAKSFECIPCTNDS